MELPSCGNCMVAVLAESTLDHCMVSASLTVVDSGGFPIHYFLPECAEEYRSNVETHDDTVVREPDPKLVERPGYLPLAAVVTRATSLEVQSSWRQAVVCRLPEHLRCVLQHESGQTTLSVAQLEETVELLLMYEDCFVGASGKVGWTDMATHFIDTGVSRPVKQPPWRTSFEEKDQIERQLSELLGWQDPSQ